MVWCVPSRQVMWAASAHTGQSLVASSSHGGPGTCLGHFQPPQSWLFKPSSSSFLPIDSTQVYTRRQDFLGMFSWCHFHFV